MKITIIQRTSWLLALTIVALQVPGCGANNTFSPQLIGAVGAAFSISAAPSNVGTPSGGSANYTLTFRSTGGFSSTINLSISGLPQGASGAFNPTSLIPTPGGASSTLTVNTTGIAPGTYNLTVTATGGGVTRTINLTLRVTGYTINISPNIQDLTTEAPANYTITVTPLNGFVGQVNLSVSGLPAFITSSFNNNPLTFNVGSGAQNSTLQLIYTVGEAIQTFTFTVTGTTGPYSASSTGQVRVIPGGYPE